MLDRLTLADVVAHLGQTCPLHLDDGSVVPLILEAAEGLGGRAPGAGRDPFSIQLLGPRDRRLPQRTYRIELPPVGPCEIFIVPIALIERGYRYEAIFT